LVAELTSTFLLLDFLAIFDFFVLLLVVLWSVPPAWANVIPLNTPSAQSTVIIRTIFRIIGWFSFLQIKIDCKSSVGRAV
jgi:hypothetical protein